MKILSKETYMDKSEWARGEWDDEPDRIEWRHEKEPHFPCLIVRNVLGSLCGYVGVNESHAYYEKDCDEVVAIDVHGGITFSDRCRKGSNIGPTPLENESDKVWWLGFHCAHWDDVQPYFGKIMRADFPEVTYKNIDYVIAEINSLAEQLAPIKEDKNDVD